MARKEAPPRDGSDRKIMCKLLRLALNSSFWSELNTSIYRAS